MSAGDGGHTYRTYLQLDRLLSSQLTQTDSDDELLFIVIHQANELWFKLAIHELRVAIAALMQTDGDAGALAAFRVLSRVSRIQELLTQTSDILGTLTPDEFKVFRSTVGRDGASGFQSMQYREFEILLGVRDRFRSFVMVDPQTGRKLTRRVDMLRLAVPEERDRLTTLLTEPGLYDAVVRHLAGSFAVTPRPAAEYGTPYTRRRDVFDAWEAVYRDRNRHIALYQLAEKLVDLEDAFRHWRYRHMATVARVIGAVAGTGRSSGLDYLRKTAFESFDRPLFPELWDVRNKIFDPDRFFPTRAGYD